MHPREDCSARDRPDRLLVEIPCEAGKSLAGTLRVWGDRVYDRLALWVNEPGYRVVHLWTDKGKQRSHLVLESSGG